jgi:hypothetical protein
MELLRFCYPVLAVSIIYCIWQIFERSEAERRNGVMRQRVAFLLWNAAKQIPDSVSVADAGSGGSAAARATEHNAIDRARQTRRRWKAHSAPGAKWHAECDSFGFSPQPRCSE